MLVTETVQRYYAAVTCSICFVKLVNIASYQQKVRIIIEMSIDLIEALYFGQKANSVCAQTQMCTH